MSSNYLTADNGVSSGVTGITQSAGNDGTLQIRTTTSGGTATTAVTVDNAQNVGVGVTPSTWSSGKAIEIGFVGNGVFGLANNNFLITQNAYYNSGFKYASGSSLPSSYYQQTNGTHAWGIAGSGTAGNAITYTTAMSLDNNGNFLVGTTSQIGSEQVGISFADATKNGLGIQTQGSTSGAGFVVFRISSGAPIGNISRVGTTSAVVYNTTSDQRLKSNIADATSVLDKLISIKVRQFDWTEGDLHQDYGFIAQELEPVLSGIVTKGKTEEDIWQLDYSRLTPHLVKAIQELSAQVTSLQATVETQATTIATLQNKIGA